VEKNLLLWKKEKSLNGPKKEKEKGAEGVVESTCNGGRVRQKKKKWGAIRKQKKCEKRKGTISFRDFAFLGGTRRGTIKTKRNSKLIITPERNNSLDDRAPHWGEFADRRLKRTKKGIRRQGDFVKGGGEGTVKLEKRRAPFPRKGERKETLGRGDFFLRGWLKKRVNANTR